MFDWAIHGPPKILNFQGEAKLEQIIAIVTMRSVSGLKLHSIPLGHCRFINRILFSSFNSNDSFSIDFLMVTKLLSVL